VGIKNFLAKRRSWGIQYPPLFSYKRGHQAAMIKIFEQSNSEKNCGYIRIMSSYKNFCGYKEWSGVVSKTRLHFDEASLDLQVGPPILTFFQVYTSSFEEDIDFEKTHRNASEFSIVIE
jgi:hypothetical protein